MKSLIEIGCSLIGWNQSAPLLLGQSVLNKLGKIEIDNDKRNLKITYKPKK